MLVALRHSAFGLVHCERSVFRLSGCPGRSPERALEEPRLKIAVVTRGGARVCLQPPIVVLNVVVMEAEGLEAKDANGFSDPYCMLGIQPGSAGAGPPPSPSPYVLAAAAAAAEGGGGGGCDTPPPSPRPSPAAARALSDSGVETAAERHDAAPHEKLRKHHSLGARVGSFRLSFKRKEHGYGRERRDRDAHRDSLSVQVPAKDHDDESSVFDAVSKLNEVRGVKGLGRFFKQIAQSARSGSQDDFLGCVNIPLQEIPSTGLERWYKLEARTQRSNIQGRLRLKLWLSTREDRGNSEEDSGGELRQQEQLHAVFIEHELARFGVRFPRLDN
ncbi:Uncharacterized protein GBIM_17982 [Gryllus bimaculatus]|nr:Uncharacterized protein GBIM_17982 [Gryllus bimaculatus]